MNAGTSQMIRIITSELTGRREKDIAYLKDQIRVYRLDSQIRAVLENILRSLSFPTQNSAAA